MHDLQQDDGHISFAVDDAALSHVLGAVAALHPRSLVANPPSLEELFLRHYGPELAALTGVERSRMGPPGDPRGRPVGGEPASDTLAGTGTMIQLVLRRNGDRLAVWWVVIVGLFAYVGVYYKDIFTTRPPWTTSPPSATCHPSRP